MNEHDTAQRPQTDRVVIVGPAPPYRGGIAQHTARMAEQMIAEGLNVTVESWDRQYPRLLYRRAERDDGASAAAVSSFSLKWFSPWSWWKVARRSRNVDHLVLQWVTPFHVAVYLALRLFSGAKRTSVVVHNAIPHESFPLLKALTRIGFGGVDGVVCHADAVVEDLRSLGVSAAGTVTVPMPPLIRTRIEPLPPRPPIRLLFLGYLRPYKGPDIAVDAMTRLPAHLSDSVVLTIAGESWDGEPSIAELVTELGLDDRVEVQDRYLSDTEMLALIGRHHLVVAPYRTATQSGVVSLALASGRPTVATDVGGLAELVTPGTNGVLCVPNDVDAFAHAVGEAIDDLDTLFLGATQTRNSWSDVVQAVLGERT